MNDVDIVLTYDGAMDGESILGTAGTAGTADAIDVSGLTTVEVAGSPPRPGAIVKA